MLEIGRAGALFADDTEVQKHLRDFYSAVIEQSRLRAEIDARGAAGSPDASDAGRFESTTRGTTNLLISLIKELSRSANFSVQSLSDSDVRGIFTMLLTNPSGFSTFVINAGGSPQPTPPARLSPTQLLALVQEAARALNVGTRSIEPVYSRMPPAPDEPRVIKVRTSDGRTAVVRTPGDMPAATIRGLIVADLTKDLGIGMTSPQPSD